VFDERECTCIPAVNWSGFPREGLTLDAFVHVVPRKTLFSSKKKNFCIKTAIIFHKRGFVTIVRCHSMAVGLPCSILSKFLWTYFHCK
jgi:hypothetical protein